MSLVFHSSSSSKLFFRTTRDLFGSIWQSIENFNLLSKSQSLWQPHGNSVFYSSLARRNEDNKNIEKVTVMNEFKKHAFFAFKECAWETFFATPYKWYDCRRIKRNKNAPDFRHIDTGEVLWIESHEAPAWALYKVNSLGREAFAPAPSIEDLWKILFNDPSKWVDNRKMKKSNKQPDFVSKDTNEALWIDSKKIPTWVTPMLNNLQSESFAIFYSVEDLWTTFFADPSIWFDDRKIKKSSKYPDFKCMSTGMALWLHDRRTPVWVKPMLKEVHEKAFATSPSKEDLWKTLFADPSKWFDDRKIKKSNKHPDFRHKDTHETLWIMDIKTPCWVTPMLNNLQEKEFSASPCLEGLWDSFFADPSKWVDNRSFKKSNKYPDFKHKDFREALWIKDIRTPAWVVVELSKLGNDAFASHSTKKSSC